MKAIKLKKISKKYYTTEDRPIFLKNLFVPQKKEAIWALKNVSLEIQKGEAVGIIGENGSGKSTLLKIIAGITHPTRGEVEAQGRAGSLIELGAGFHPDLTGKENVYLNGALLGFTKEELDKKYDEIVNFADIGEFISQPVRTYSSGMVVRLGFSVAIHLDPDILLIDEVIAVGDISFQRKVLERIHQFKSQGKTIIFVSHSLDQVEHLCSRTVWLEKGRLRAFAESKKAISLYLDDIDRKEEEARREGGVTSVAGRRWGTGEIVIDKVKILDGKGKEKYIFKTGEKISLELNYRIERKIKDPNFGVGIFSLDGSYIFGTTTLIDDFPIDRRKKGGKIRLNLEKIPLLENTYLITVGVTDGDNWNTPADVRDKSNKFKIKKSTKLPFFKGLSLINHRWQIL